MVNRFARRDSALDPWQIAIQQLPVPRPSVRLILPAKIGRDYEQAAAAPPDAFIPSLLNAVRVETVVSDADLARIPPSGSIVIVANHPFGILEGLVLTRLFENVRPDAGQFTGCASPEMRRHLIVVNRHIRQCRSGGDGDRCAAYREE